MKKNIIIFVILTLFLNSCGSSMRNIYLKKDNTNSSVYVDDALITTPNKDGNLKTKVESSVLFRQLTYKEIGYKDEYDILGATGANIFGSGVFRYPTGLIGSPTKTKVITKQENQKHIYLTKSSLDIKKEKFTIYSNYYYYHYKNQISNTQSKANDDFKIDNTIFTDDLNKTLKKDGFTDTTGTVLKSQLNTLYVKCSINNVKLTEFKGLHELNVLVPGDYAYFVDLGLTWEILDSYEQVLYKHTTSVTSGKFSRSFANSKKEDPIAKSFSDGLQKSLYELLAKNEVQSLLKIGTEVSEKNEQMKITAPSSKITSVENAIEANVTVITNKGHGSGFAITEDGYIITNFHVIAGAKEINVQTNQGKKVKAKLVRKNEFADLALLKVEEKFQYAFSVPQDINFTVGSEIFAIGTPKAIEFGQTLTKGIISAKRKKETQEIIQTDASVNSGNSGGALVNKNAELVGVVNAKLMGVGVEGIAFAIIAKDIWQYLDLTY